jgi:putative redox protein
MALIKACLADGKFGMDIMDADGHSMRMDIPAEQGGSGSGFRPMQTLLAAVCGCSAVDIISILKKQRQQLETLEIEVDGQREAGVEPSLWQSVQLIFKLGGDVEPAKAFRAVDLSLQKYCSVAETLRVAGADITFTVSLNGVVITATQP